MNEIGKFLPEDVYSFLGNNIGIRSNSREILAYFKSAYGRFYLGNNDATPNLQAGLEKKPRHVIQVVDNLSSSNEILVDDEDQVFRLKCKNLYNFDYDYYSSMGTVPDPLSHIDAVFTMKVYDLAKGFNLFHAGSVSWKGEGMIFPAISGMGKTTLTLRLVKQGFKFLSDEVACLNPERDIVEPFFLKLNLSDNSRRLLELPPLPDTFVRLTGSEEKEWRLDIEDIVPYSLSHSCPLQYVLFLQGFGEKPRLEYISPSNALFKLFKFSFSRIKDPANMLFKFAPLIERVACFNLVMGDLDETVEVIMQMIDGRRTNEMGIDDDS